MILEWFPGHISSGTALTDTGVGAVLMKLDAVYSALGEAFDSSVRQMTGGNVGCCGAAVFAMLDGLYASFVVVKYGWFGDGESEFR